jgi:flagellar biosynthesis/type III secretory pathway chaperone
MHSLGQWDELADALRDELAEYGGLLGLLDEQREAISRRNLDLLTEVNLRVQEQAAAAIRCKNIRELAHNGMARAAGLPENATIRDLIARMPMNVRPMFESLAREGADVAEKAREKAKRNNTLLTHAGDLNDKLLMAARPRSATRTYNARGGTKVKAGDTSGGGLDLSA